MNWNRIEQIRRRLRGAKLNPPIAISSIYYLEDVDFLLNTIEELTSEPSSPPEMPEQRKEDMRENR